MGMQDRFGDKARKATQDDLKAQFSEDEDPQKMKDPQKSADSQDTMDDLEIDFEDS